PVFRIRVDLSLLCTVAAGHRPSLTFAMAVLATSCLSGSPWSSFAHSGDLRKEAELLRPLCSVFGAPLLPILHALGIEHTAQDVVAHPRQVLDAAAADHHHGMLLQIVAFARDVADHLEAVRESHLRDLAQGRVRLLRGRGVNPGTHATLLRALLQRRHLLLRMLRNARLADELVDGRHRPACWRSLSYRRAAGLISTRTNGRAPCAPGAFGAHPFHRGPLRAKAKRSCTFSSDSRQRQRLSFIHRGW